MYTDGSSRGNPGPGGWGAILIINRQETADNREYEDVDEVIELGGGEKLTTNNRMELMGAIEGLGHVTSYSSLVTDESGEKLQASNYKLVTSVEVCTDSEYVKKGITEWINGWIAKGWKTSTKKPVLNQDLWEQLYKEEKRLKDAGVKVVWTYVPGHAGIPLNERADVIATSYADEEIEKGASNLQLYRGSKEAYSHLHE
ncbi:MAG: hypothetical protein RI935_247 [Candidatus Parcubacteria bacterium]